MHIKYNYTVDISWSLQQNLENYREEQISVKLVDQTWDH